MRRLDPATGPPELLALRALKLGDLLVAVPALHGLRRRYPDHRLCLAVPGWLEPIVDLVPGVDALLPTPGLDDLLPVPAGGVNIAVNLHGNGPESRGVVAALAARLTIAHAGPGTEQGPQWLDGIHERVRWARLVGAWGAPADPDEVSLAPPRVTPPVDRATVVHVGAFYGSRRWPVDRFAAVAAALAEDGARVVLTGSEAERPRAELVAAAAGLDEGAVLAGRLDLAGFAAVIHAAELVVSADTGAAHLASAYGVASVVLFGPASPREWGPPAGGPHLVLTDETQRRGDTFGDTPDPALLAVSVADVLAAARSLAGARVVTGRR